MKREEKMLAHLKEVCLGLSLAVSGRELEQALKIRDSDLRKMVNRMRKNGELIGSCQEGYFYIETFGEAQITLRHLEQMIRGLEATKQGLLRGMNDLPLKKTGGESHR